jgi:ERCC4-type nuclease
MKIKIDCREHDLIKQIHKMMEEIPRFKDIKIEIISLPIGDIIIENSKESIKLLIERKSINDLLSSIKDGRYEEQSYRLTSYEHHNHNIIYIIEGDINRPKSFLNKSNDKQTVHSAILSLNYYKGFSVIRTFSLEETAFYILNSTNKIGKENDKDMSYYSENNQHTQPATCKDYINVVKKVKKDNITPENINEIMLCQIPSISSTTAKAILEKYKSITNIIDELKKDTNCLKNITYTNKKGDSRKINKNVGDILQKFLIT